MKDNKNTKSKAPAKKKKVKKNTKYLIIISICAVVLVGVLLALIFWPKEDVKLEETLDYGTKITQSVDDKGVHQVDLVLNDKGELDNNSYGTLMEYIPAEVTHIKVENTGGSYEIKSVTPTKTDENGNVTTEATQYTLIGFEDFELQPGQADSVANNLSSIDFTSVASVDGGNPADFGFDKPRSTATVTYSDDTKAIVIVGNDAAGGAGTYIKFGSSDAIYLCPTESVHALLLTVNDLIARDVNHAPESTENSYVQSVTLSGTLYPQTIEFVPNTDTTSSASYKLTKPSTLFANESNTSKVTGAIRGLYSDAVAFVNPSAKQLSDTGLDKPYAQLKAVYPDTTVELIASKPNSEGNVYIMEKGAKVIYTMKSASLPWTTLSYEELISEYVCNPKAESLTSMTVNDGSKTYNFKLSTESKTSTDDEGNETTTTKTSVKEGNLILTFDYFNNYFQNVAYTQRIDLKADKPSGTPLFTVKYTYADKDGVDTVCFYPADASGKCVATLNGTVMGKVYEGRVKNLITQTAHAAKDDIVANLA